MNPLTEDVLHAGPPHPSNEGYAYAKRMMDVHSRILEQEGIQSICLIPTNIYGPNDNFNLNDAHVMPALIHRCYLAKKSDTPFVVKGTGKPIRQFIHSRDLAKIILWSVHKCTESGRLLDVLPNVLITNMRLYLIQHLRMDNIRKQSNPIPV